MVTSNSDYYVKIFDLTPAIKHKKIYSVTSAVRCCIIAVRNKMEIKPMLIKESNEPPWNIS